MSTVTVTDESFERDVLQSDKPVLVDFWAEWCGPCKQIGPALEQIADELAGQVVIAKVNIDDSPMIPSKLSSVTLTVAMGGTLQIGRPS